MKVIGRTGASYLGKVTCDGMPERLLCVPAGSFHGLSRKPDAGAMPRRSTPRLTARGGISRECDSIIVRRSDLATSRCNAGVMEIGFAGFLCR